MSAPESPTSSETLVNGTFLDGIAPQAALTSPLSPAVNTVAARYIGENELGFALGLMKDQQINVLADYWENGALVALADSTTASGFNDTTSVGEFRTRPDYLGPVLGRACVPRNSHNEDPEDRFPGLRPRGFAIGQNDQPVMAIVALDPSKLAPNLPTESLIEEVNELRAAAAGSDETIRNAAGGAMSSNLRQVLSECLLANDTIVNTHSPDGAIEKWGKPFDLIASLKALYTLLSGEDSSAAMRQGAVRMTNPQGQHIIVGGSGLNSAIDEMVARNFARDVFAKQA